MTGISTASERRLELPVRPLEGQPDRGIARLPLSAMAKLGIASGDILAVEGRRRHLLRAMPGRDLPDGVVGLDPCAIENASLLQDRPLVLAQAAPPPATEIRLEGPDRPGAAAACRAALLDRPLREGDRVRPFGTGPAWRVVAVSPAPEAQVRASTAIRLSLAGEPAWSGLGGLAEPVARLREMVELPLHRPELFVHLGIDPPRGVLLSGPPGTGKTLLARAAAKAAGLRFLTVNGPEIVSKHYGDSEARLREVFAEAARNAPSIVFIDEIDAIAPRRDGLSGEKQLERRVVGQLLTLLDGLSDRGRIVVIAATNMPEGLDPALRRPGRFDREIVFTAPDAAARTEILDIHLGGMPLDPAVSLRRIADRTPGYVGADLAALAREAGLAAIARAGAAVPPGELRITLDDIEAALAATGPSALRSARAEIPRTRLADIGGLAEAKQALVEAVIWPRHSAQLCEAYGVAPPAGLLLTGPPGGGKTLLARALAGESGVNFIPVRGPDLLSPHLGEAERRIADLFVRARHAAPAILFLDELDALAPARGTADAAMTRVVGQLLVEIDGIEALRGVILLGATNRAQAIDAALLRPGRFDRVIEIAPPDRFARREILALHARAYPVACSVDLDSLAARTVGWSGADLAALCADAARHALRRALAPGHAPEDAPKVGPEAFEAALAERHASEAARGAPRKNVAFASEGGDGDP